MPKTFSKKPKLLRCDSEKWINKIKTASKFANR